MKITKLTQSKKVPDRYYLTLDDGSELKINVAIIADFSLFTGRELTEEELSSLKQRAGESAAKARALKIVNARPVSKAELYERLIEKGESEENAAMATEWMQSLGFINDKEYALLLARHYAAKGYGEGRIKNEFYRRRVPKELWEEALLELPPTDNAIDKFITSRLKGREPDKKELKRLTDALLRRGFGWDEIKSALSRYNDNIEEF